MEVLFPQYRKLKDRSFYKIDSEYIIVEVQRIGSKYATFTISVNNFGNRVFLNDLLACEGPYERMEANEFLAIQRLVKDESAS